jgi:flagellin
MGSFSILNNISGTNAQNQLNINNIHLSRTMLRLSSGKRINGGADDAAGLQIADSLRANTYALNQAIRNANDGISVCQIADGALQEVTNLLTRSVTLAEEAATETVDSSGRASLQAEYRQINMEIARIANQTNFNGTSIFKENSGFDASVSVFVGDLSGASSISVSIGFLRTGSYYAQGLDDETAFWGVNGDQFIDFIDLSLSQESAAQGLEKIRVALNDISNIRGRIGAGVNQLQSAVAVLQAQSQNTQAAESSIRDANMAEEVANMTKHQILAQSGIAALAQANSNSQLALQLLRG